MTMRKTFFERLGIADMEKIHSQIISFIFTDQCDAISNEYKREMLIKLFPNKSDKLANLSIDKLNSYTEYNSIDIIIVCETHLFVIENKLKSNQHSDQLNTYKNKIQEDKNFIDLTIIYGFLTLINEESDNDKWENISYSDFYNLLNNIELLESEYKPFIIDYRNYLEQLTKVVDLFDKHSHDFKNVFRDSMKSKYEKMIYIENSPLASEAEYIDERNFISRNNLEKILQYRFYIKKIVPSVKIPDLTIIPKIDHSGRGGNATFHINFNETYESKDKIKFRFGFQYDGSLIKFCFMADDYKKVKKADLPKEVIDYFKEHLQNKFDCKNFSPAKTLTFMNVNKKYEIENNNVEQIQEKLKTELKTWYTFYSEKIVPLFKKNFERSYWND